MALTEIDSVDRRILDLLIEDGRRSVKEVADIVGLSPSPVRRRIERLEDRGIITGYTAVVDESGLSPTFEAFAELRFAGDTKVSDITASVKGIPEVTAVYTVAGDPDAIVHFRLDDLSHLHQVIDRIRRGGHVIGTKTLMVLDSWQRGRD
ncbi:Lrp/AsnC family transcriptional regulator [Nocardioides yefusunii]|uniref:Lrp/AsnC family transcriptional regulator n=1 Tax=Nocardioides yefusunii TaxID=2500546 RepID=A0ABW1QTJ1_9ACTN|nr:Lrp/AsnC family transcriptional regulator [Nocardioides yefusunii]